MYRRVSCLFTIIAVLCWTIVLTSASSAIIIEGCAIVLFDWNFGGRGLPFPSWWVLGKGYQLEIASVTEPPAFKSISTKFNIVQGSFIVSD